jgi:ribonuclease HI
VPLINFKIKHKLPAGTSVFSAEAWAALQAMQLTIDRGWKKVIIFTDSLSLLHALKNCLANCSNHLLAKLRHISYQALNRGLQIFMVWIPAHIGIQGNEEADQTAKEAARSGNKIYFKILHSDLYSEATKASDKVFQAHLEDAFRTKGRMYGQL